nr:DUF4352 domain-containing protein [Streptococcus macacae]
MQKDTLSSKRQWLKSLGVLNKPFSEDYYSATRNYARVKRHYIGESVTLGTGEQMTVTSLKYDADIKLKDASDNDKTAVLSVNIKNTKSRPIQFNIKDFYVLDNIYDLAKLSSDSRNKKGTSVIQPGQTIKTKVYFTIPKEGPYLVIYGKDYWMPNSDERQGSSSNSL